MLLTALCQLGFMGFQMGFWAPAGVFGGTCGSLGVNNWGLGCQVELPKTKNKFPSKKKFHPEWKKKKGKEKESHFLKFFEVFSTETFLLVISI